MLSVWRLYSVDPGYLMNIEQLVESKLVSQTEVLGGNLFQSSTGIELGPMSTMGSR
jgi:hypothetical protein